MQFKGLPSAVLRSGRCSGVSSLPFASRLPRSSAGAAAAAAATVSDASVARFSPITPPPTPPNRRHFHRSTTRAGSELRWSATEGPHAQPPTGWWSSTRALSLATLTGLLAYLYGTKNLNGISTSVANLKAVTGVSAPRYGNARDMEKVNTSSSLYRGSGGHGC